MIQSLACTTNGPRGQNLRIERMILITAPLNLTWLSAYMYLNARLETAYSRYRVGSLPFRYSLSPQTMGHCGVIEDVQVYRCYFFFLLLSSRNKISGKSSRLGNHCLYTGILSRGSERVKWPEPTVMLDSKPAAVICAE